MTTGYEDIEKLTTNQNQMLDNALTQQQDIVNKQTEQNVAELERQKAEIDKQTEKTNQGLYTEYKKASNPYGVNTEQLYARGLGNSGYAETTQTNLYNTYQKNVTDTINSAQKLKSDFDFEISKARQNGDITLAQNALQIYTQKMQLLTQEYELKNNREQYLYQKEQDALAQSNWEKEWARQQERDAVSDSQWQQSFEYNKGRDEVSDQQWRESFDYQKGRDEVSDNQWQQSFDYNKSRDEVSDSQWQQSFDYQKGRDQVSDQQWQQTMDYQKQRDAVSDSQWAKEYALSSRKASSSNTNYKNLAVEDNNTSVQNTSNNSTFQKLYDNLTQATPKDNMSKKVFSNLIYGEFQNGNITEEEASYLFNKFGL